MTIDEAMESGAMALFGEKYGDEVRVVTMGTSVAQEGGGAQSFSVELCGGTHVGRTGDIGTFKIVAEGAVAAGVRRVEAVTGAAALAYLGKQDARLQRVAGLLKVQPDEVAARVGGLVEDRRRLEREIAELRRKLALAGGQAQPTRDVCGVQVISQILSDVPAKELKSIADGLKQQVGSGVVVIIGGAAGKASIVVGVSADLTARFSAVDLVRIGADRLGGKGGGGRPDMAQAGGTNLDAAPDAVEAICEAMLTTG
jgi:alanyl-tRNA synthetase